MATSSRIHDHCGSQQQQPSVGYEARTGHTEDELSEMDPTERRRLFQNHLQDNSGHGNDDDDHDDERKRPAKRSRNDNVDDDGMEQEQEVDEGNSSPEHSNRDRVDLFLGKATNRHRGPKSSSSLVAAALASASANDMDLDPFHRSTAIQPFRQPLRQQQRQQNHSFKVRPLKSKTLFRTMDEIHRSIDLKEPVIQMFLNSKYYQRLRRVHQLGSTFWVYPGATHTRFEHSLGVAHLAKKLCEKIVENQPNLGTTKVDILCVTLAGLCHDLGHGPYSHIFEQFRSDIKNDIFATAISKSNDGNNSPTSSSSSSSSSFFGTKFQNDLKQTYEDFQDDYEECWEDIWPHERSSVFMIDAILRENGLAIDYSYTNLDQPLRQIGDGIDANTVVESSTGKILTNRDLIFVKECIMGDKDGKTIPEVQNATSLESRVGREELHKEWLYDVVSNRHNGIDVDKMDYFVRDAKHTIAQDGIMDVIIEDAIVAKGQDVDCKDHYMICYADKRINDVSAFFRNRFDLHEKVYQHKTVTGSARMIVDIFRLAEPYFRLDGKPLSLSVLNADTFYECDDEILTCIKIAAETNPRLQPAKDLINRFKARELYGFAGEKVLDVKKNSRDNDLWNRSKKDKQSIAKEIFDIEGSHGNDPRAEQLYLDLDDIIVERCYLHEGQKDKNPLDSVRFAQRTDLKEFDGDNHEPLLAYPPHMQPHLQKLAYDKCCLRFYSRNTNKTDLLRHKFETWVIRQKEGVLNGQQTVLPARRGNGGGDDCNNDDAEPHNHQELEARLLTQETDNEITPPRNLSRRSNPSIFHHNDDSFLSHEDEDGAYTPSSVLKSGTTSPGY